MAENMIIDGQEYVKTHEGYVRADIIDDAKPHKVQLFISGTLAFYAGVVGTVIYQIKYPKDGDIIGAFSYNLLVMSQQLLGEAVLVAVPVIAMLAVYVFFVRVDAATQITKSIMLSALLIWICAGFALLYGFENNPADNLIGRYTVGVSINLLGKPATVGLFWLLLFCIVVNAIEKNTGWSFWDNLNNHKKKVLRGVTCLQHQVIANLRSVTKNENIGLNVTMPEILEPQVPPQEIPSLGEQIASIRPNFQRQPFTAPLKSVFQNDAEIMTHADLESADLGEIKLVLDWLEVNGLVMISADAGIGKTRFTLAMCCAIATGTDFLGWRVYGARQVLYIDGEMGKILMRDRIRSFGVSPKNLKFLSYDMCSEQNFPNICTAKGQSLIERVLTKYELDSNTVIVLDSLKTLSKLSIKYPKAYAIFHEWILSLKKRGYTVIIIHHNNKQGKQDGSEDKSVALNNIAYLTRPVGHVISDNETRFHFEFDKVRECRGADLSPSEIVCRDGQWLRESSKGKTYSWNIQENIHPQTPDSVNIQVNNSNSLNMQNYSDEYSPEYAVNNVNIQNIQDEKALNNRVIQLSKEGKTQLEIADELGISQPKVSRILARAS